MTSLNELIEQGNYAEAVTWCENELTINPSSDIQYNLAFSYYNLAYQKDNDNPEVSFLEKSSLIFENLLAIYQNENVSIASKYRNLFDVSMYLVEIYYALQKPEDTLKHIENAFNFYPYNHEANHRLANIALNLNSLTLGGTIASQYFLFTSLEGELDKGELMQKMYQLYENGHYSEEMLYALSLTYRNSDYCRVETHQERVDEMIGFLIKYPNSVLLQGAMGNLFFFNSDYETALSYYEKTLGHPKASPNWYARYIVGHALHFGSVPKDLPAVTSINAIEVYSGASRLLMDSESLEETQPQLYYEIMMYRETLLAQSYHLFDDFFNHGKGSSFCLNEHWFAMSCNDYGIVLKEKGEYQKSLDIHKIGFQYTVFSAQLMNALRTANQMENGVEISEIYKWYDETQGISPESIGAVFYIEAKNYFIKALKYTNCDNNLRKIANEEFLNEINSRLQFYQKEHIASGNMDFFEGIIDNLKAELVAIDANMNVSPEKSLAMQEALKIAKEDPNNFGNWYVLFQMQHTNNLFKDCIASAIEYERSKYEMSDKITDEERGILYYRKGSSLVRTGEAYDGVQLLTEAEQINPTDYWIKHDLALGNFDINQIEKAVKYLDFCVNHYQKDNLNWDDEIEALCRKAIHIMNQKGNKKWVVKLADFMLKNVPNDKEIKDLKKKNTNLFGF